MVELEARGDTYVPGKFLTEAELGDASEGAEFRPLVYDDKTQRAVAPNGSLGFRFSESGMGRWNLDLGELAPRLTLYGAESVTVELPRFDQDRGKGGVLQRGVPVKRIGKRVVTTVFDLVLAQYGVPRAGLPGKWPAGYDDAMQPYTPAWQEAITSVPPLRPRASLRDPRVGLRGARPGWERVPTKISNPPRF